MNRKHTRQELKSTHVHILPSRNSMFLYKTTGGDWFSMKICSTDIFHWTFPSDFQLFHQTISTLDEDQSIDYLNHEKGNLFLFYKNVKSIQNYSEMDQPKDTVRFWFLDQPNVHCQLVLF